VQAVEVARLKQEEEERKVEQARARVEREAQRQREHAAVKKEQEAKRAAAQEAKAKALRGRGAAKHTSISRAPPQKSDYYTTARKYLKEHQIAAALSTVVVFILFVMALALRE
jgi:membrane protein involved in colicin uptake